MAKSRPRRSRIPASCQRSQRRLSLSTRRGGPGDRKSTRLNSSHPSISYAVFCLKKKKIDFDYIGLLWLGDLTWRHYRWIFDPALVFETGMLRRRCAAQAFFFNDTATTEIYTLSLHDALPI